MAHSLILLVSGQTSNLSQHPFLLSLDEALGYFSIAALAKTSRSELDHEVIPFHHPFSSGSSGSSVIQSGPTAAHQASLSITSSWSLLKLMSIELVMPSNHLILCHPLLLLSSIFPSIRVFSNESVLQIRWPKYWSFSYNITPSNEFSGLISFRMD